MLFRSERTAGNLLPLLSSASKISALGELLPSAEATLAAAATRRDAGLARDLIEERSGYGGP